MWPVFQLAFIAIHKPSLEPAFRVRAAIPAILLRLVRRRQGRGRGRPLLAPRPPLFPGGHRPLPDYEEGHQKVTQGEMAGNSLSLTNKLGNGSVKVRDLCCPARQSGR